MNLKTSLDLSLIQLIYSVDNPGGQNEICTKEQIMREYSDLFKGVGLIPGDVELHLKPDAVPVINAPRESLLRYVKDLGLNLRVWKTQASLFMFHVRQIGSILL